jgi:hypothetical protein
MKRWILRIVAGLALAAGILAAQIVLLSPDADTTERTGATIPAAWQSMTEGEVVIEGPGGRRQDVLAVRIADETAERAQGMQHLPARVVRDNPIWFVFPEPRRTGWHMRNVRIPLDIVYVDGTGTVIAIERMEPAQTGYGIDAPIAAALEVAAGDAERLGIVPGARLSLAR